MFYLTGSEDRKSQGHMGEQIARIFKEFLARVAKLEELVTVGKRFLLGFQQGLEFLRRPPLSETSELVKNIIKANNTKRLQAYIQAGCINTHDSVQSIVKSKCVLDELNGLIEDVTDAIQTLHEDSLCFQDKQLASGSDKKEDSVYNMEASSYSGAEVTDYACMMGIIYCMLKQDYKMQEKIVSALNLKSSSEELETYCLMWTLRPFINDELLCQAWKLIP